MQVHFPLEARGKSYLGKCAAIKRPNSTRSFHVTASDPLKHFLHRVRLFALIYPPRRPPPVTRRSEVSGEGIAFAATETN